MFDRIEIFRMAHALALHSGARQAEIAANVANADTPGYRARDIAAFSEVYGGSAAQALRATRPGHIFESSALVRAVPVLADGDAAAPNGNTVSIEGEMIKAVEVQHAHDTALAVYESARSILRTALGKGR